MRKVFRVVGWLALLSATVAAAEARWDFPAYVKAMKESGRTIGSMNEKEFLALQGRKEKVLQVIEKMLQESFGRADPVVLEAFRRVPREYFMYDYEKGSNLAASTYEIPFREWPIGFGSVLSDYIVQSYMTALVEPKPTDVSLEIGTGSGYQSALLSQLVREAYTIEIITRLGERVGRIYPPLGYANIRARTGDGFYGWPEVKEGFDIIVVTCAAPFVPPMLLEQLKPGGRLVIPIGQPYKRQFLYLFTKDREGKVRSRKDAGVIFIPMKGEISRQPPQQP